MSTLSDSSKRLTNLKQATLIKYLDEINLDEDLDLYDKMISHFTMGDLDEEFSSSYLNDKTKEEKKELMQLVHKYGYLCFKDENYDYWADSILNIPLSDCDFLCSQLFDNFNFLVKICNDNGEVIPKFLKKFIGNKDYEESSIIDTLGNSFDDDKILEKFLIDMSGDYSLFNLFSTEQLALMLKNPKGILYDYTDDSITFYSPVELALKIYKKATGSDYDLVEDDFESVKNLVFALREDSMFDDALIELQVDSINKVKGKNARNS